MGKCEMVKIGSEFLVHEGVRIMEYVWYKYDTRQIG